MTAVGLYAYMKNNNTVQTFISDETLSKGTAHSESNPHWATAHDYYWPKASTLDFWAWAPKTVSSAVSLTAPTVSDPGTDDAKMSFTYNLAPGTPSVPAAAVDQPDLMFAVTTDASKTSVNANGCVGLDFKHALAAVKFVVKSNVAGKLTSIKIGNAAYTGSCDFTKANGFSWTGLSYLSGDQAFEQEFNLDVDADKDVAAVKKDSHDNNTAVFMMIPQALKAKSPTVTDYQRVTFTFTQTGGSAKTYTGCLYTTSVPDWEAGHVYVYTITLPDVNVKVDDAVTDYVKSGVQITNTGTTLAYIRAAIVANWVDKNGKIINYPWKSTDTNQGQFSGLPGTDWSLGGDGFYYYAKQVRPGQDTAQPLFGTYTVVSQCPGTGVAAKNAHLEMNIVVQAIQASQISDYAGKTSTEAQAYGWQTQLLSTDKDPEVSSK